MLKSSLCNYSDTYILVQGTITVSNTAARKKVIFKICTPFTDFMNEMNNIQINNAEDVGVVVLVYNLIEYTNTNNYLKNPEFYGNIEEMNQL